jgi:hypothetical protein
VVERFSGKYLATVVDNEDPKGLARIRVVVPEVFDTETTGWCVPCSPYSGAGVGLAAVPPVGSVVFVEWTAGDTARVPIWSGGLWPDGSGVKGAGPDGLVLVTPGGHRIALRDRAGSEAVEIRSASGATITLDSDGATIAFGRQRVALKRGSISINDGALEIA